jgi:hypothetical protein
MKGERETDASGRGEIRKVRQEIGYGAPSLVALFCGSKDDKECGSSCHDGEIGRAETQESAEIEPTKCDRSVPSLLPNQQPSDKKSAQCKKQFDAEPATCGEHPNCRTLREEVFYVKYPDSADCERTKAVK